MLDHPLIRSILDALTAERDREIKFAEQIAARLDGMKTKPPDGDQRYAILGDATSRADGLRIAIGIVTSQASAISQPKGNNHG
jgi:hypothetical protein